MAHDYLSTACAHEAQDPGHRAAGGDMLGCRYCQSVMTFRDGAWEWSRPYRDGEEQRS